MITQSTANCFVQRLFEVAELTRIGTPLDCFNALRTSLVLGPSEHVLKKIIHGEQTLVGQDQVFYCNQASFGHSEVIEQAIAFLRNEGLTPPDLLLFDINITHQDVGSMTPLVRGKAAYIRISATDEANLFAVLVHELVHASVLSGHLFLDEAIAYYFENKCIGGDLLSQIKSNKGSGLLSLRLLLEYNEKDDPFFDKLMPGCGLLIHAFGAALVEQMVLAKGVQAIIDFYQRIAQQSTKSNLVQRTENMISMSIEDVEILAGLRQPKVLSQSESAHQQTLVDFVSCKQDKVEKAYRLYLMSDNRSDLLNEIQNGIELTILTSIGVEKATSNTLSRLEFHILQSRFQWFEENYYGSVGYFMFRGLFNLIRSFTQTNKLEEIFYFDEATADLNLALGQAGKQPYVLAQMAKLNYHKLKQIGASLKPAIQLYENLSLIPQFTDAVAPVIAQLNEMEGEKNAA